MKLKLISHFLLILSRQNCQLKCKLLGQGNQLAGQIRLASSVLNIFADENVGYIPFSAEETVSSWLSCFSPFPPLNIYYTQMNSEKSELIT